MYELIKRVISAIVAWFERGTLTLYFFYFLTICKHLFYVVYLEINIAMEFLTNFRIVLISVCGW